jgi:hypothetical protein
MNNILEKSVRPIRPEKIPYFTTVVGTLAGAIGRITLELGQGMAERGENDLEIFPHSLRASR